MKDNKNYYAYFFTRQDISPEQQLVQTAHAALKLGANSTSAWDWDKDREEEVLNEYQIKNFNPDHMYFTCVGVRNEEALYAVCAILKQFKLHFEVFYEPDIGMQMTSIAVYPVHEDGRGVLKAFNLLKIGSRG